MIKFPKNILSRISLFLFFLTLFFAYKAFSQPFDPFIEGMEQVEAWVSLKSTYQENPYAEAPTDTIPELKEKALEILDFFEKNGPCLIDKCSKSLAKTIPIKDCFHLYCRTISTKKKCREEILNLRNAISGKELNLATFNNVVSYLIYLHEISRKKTSYLDYSTLTKESFQDMLDAVSPRILRGNLKDWRCPILTKNGLLGFQTLNKGIVENLDVFTLMRHLSNKDEFSIIGFILHDHGHNCANLVHSGAEGEKKNRLLSLQTARTLYESFEGDKEDSNLFKQNHVGFFLLWHEVGLYHEALALWNPAYKSQQELFTAMKDLYVSTDLDPKINFYTLDRTLQSFKKKFDESGKLKKEFRNEEYPWKDQAAVLSLIDINLHQNPRKLDLLEEDLNTIVSFMNDFYERNKDRL